MASAARTAGAPKLTPRMKLFLGGLTVIGLLVLGRQLDAPVLLRKALDWIHGMGTAGMAVFAALYLLATVLLITPVPEPERKPTVRL